jgi:hypothetical protein
MSSLPSAIAAQAVQQTLVPEPHQETYANNPSRPAVVIPGERVTVNVLVPTEHRTAGLILYDIDPTPVVQLADSHSGSLKWDGVAGKDLALPLHLTVRATQPPGRFVAARVVLRWSTGERDVIDVWALVRSTAQTSSAKNIDADFVALPDSAAPGGVVRLRFTIYNNEDTDERVRVSAIGGAEWTLREPAAAEREWLVQAYDELEGQLDLIVPATAPVGSSQLVRLLIAVIGDPGVIEARNYVAIVKGGRRGPDTSVVSGTSTFGISRVGSNGFSDAQSMGAVQVATTLAGEGNASFSYDHRVRNMLSNYRYDEEPTQIEGNVRYRRWDLTFGNRVPSNGTALTGPFVQGIGAAAHRASGGLLAEIVIARPTQFGADASGRLVRGRVGWQGKSGLLAAVTSDFARPDGSYTTVSSIQQTPMDADEQEQLDIQQAFTTAAPSNRILGGGLDVEYRPTRSQRITARAGALKLSNAAGNRLSAAVSEGSYAWSRREAATLNVRWRQMPQTLPGVYLAGDEQTIDGSVRVVSRLRMVARVFENSSETSGGRVRSQMAGTASGFSIQRSVYRLEARLNYRESIFAQRAIRRTISVNVGLPIRALRASATADVGNQEKDRTLSHIAYYRGDLRWTGTAGSLSFEVTHSQNGAAPLQRADFLASAHLRQWELAGGAWLTRGYPSGGEPGMWASIGVPVRSDLLLSVGLDRTPIEWTAQPTWRASLGVRKRFSIPLPFDRALKRDE